jgi:hypothetical protein
MSILVAFLPALILVGVLVPAYVIGFRRMGWSGWWAALVFVPFGFLALPWIMALNIRDERARVDYEDVFGGESINPGSIKRGRQE